MSVYIVYSTFSVLILFSKVGVAKGVFLHERWFIFFSYLCRLLAGELTYETREPTHTVKGKCTNKSCDVIADLYHCYK